MHTRPIRPQSGAHALPFAAMLLLVACSASSPPPPPSAAPAPATAAASDAAPAGDAPAAAAAAPEPSPAVQLMQMLDEDGDGRASRAEHADKARQMFARMDADRDGTVTADEMDVVLRSLYRDDRRAAAAAIAPVDSNHDGVLSSEEHATATGVEFGRMDADRDDFLTMAELESASAASAAR